MKIKIGIHSFSFLVLLVITNTSVKADNYSSGKKDDSLKVYRNDIAFNSIPTLQFLSGAYTGGQIRRFSLIYRHRTNHNFFLRYGLVIDRVKTSYSNNTDSAYSVLAQTDSTQIRKFDQGSHSYVKPRLVFGIEKEKGKKKLRQYYGLDVSLGAYKYYNTQFFHSYTLHVNNQNSPWEPDSGADVLIQRVDASAIFLGVSPFYGIRYEFTPHFLISAQIGFDVLMNAQTNKTENANHEIINQQDWNISGAMPGLLSDLSVVYRF